MASKWGRNKASTPPAPSFRAAARRAKLDHCVTLPKGEALEKGWTTQFGTDWFRENPEFEIEFDVSVLKGKLSLEQTVRAMFGRPPSPHHRHRHFEIGKLVAKRYRCLHTPSATKPQHASILADCSDEDIEAHKAWWDDPRRVTLKSLAESGVS